MKRMWLRRGNVVAGLPPLVISNMVCVKKCFLVLYPTWFVFKVGPYARHSILDVKTGAQLGGGEGTPHSLIARCVEIC